MAIMRWYRDSWYVDPGGLFEQEDGFVGGVMLAEAGQLGERVGGVAAQPFPQGFQPVCLIAVGEIAVPQPGGLG